MERVADHAPWLGRAAPPAPGAPHRQVIAATGALERPLSFPGNDKPGEVMLASVMRDYVVQLGLRAGAAALWW